MSRSVFCILIAVFYWIGCQSDVAKNQANETGNSGMDTPATVASPPVGTSNSTLPKDEVPDRPSTDHQQDKEQFDNHPSNGAASQNGTGNLLDDSANTSENTIQENSGKVKINIETGSAAETVPPANRVEEVVEHPPAPAELPVTPATKPVEVNSAVLDAEETMGIDTTPIEEMASTKPVSPQPVNFSHQVWNGLLKKYVSPTGKVNYTGLRNERSMLKNYLRELEKQDIDDWPREEQLVFWINAYNAHTVDLILAYYPINSIMDLDGGKVWDRKFILLNGQTLTLNDIEHQIIRPNFDEPRIHFAVNCAAKSCPPLLNEAFTAERLDRQLDRQTYAFINHPSYNNLSKNAIRISKIFDWYRDDFGQIIAFLNTYSDTPIHPNATVDFLEYNWQLNNY